MRGWKKRKKELERDRVGVEMVEGEQRRGKKNVCEDARKTGIFF